MANLFCDQDFDYRVVAKLITLGHSVILPRDIGIAERHVDDPDILVMAIDYRCAVLTHNAWDFVPLHRTVRNHWGIITCSQHTDWKEIALNAHEGICSAGDLKGTLVRVHWGGFEIERTSR